MATLPAFSPEIPYLALIPGGLRHGTMIRIKGTMNFGGQRFTINLQTGAALEPRDDCPLHVSVRPNESAIVRNHLQRLVWGTEERYGSCPIYAGQPFEVIILAESSAYKIAVNGQHHSQFNHRLPMFSVKFLSISGDVRIDAIVLEQDGPQASAPIFTAQPYPIQSISNLPIYPPHQNIPGYPAQPYVPPAPYNPGYPPAGGIPVLPPQPPPYASLSYPGLRPPHIHPRLDGSMDSSSQSYATNFPTAPPLYPLLPTVPLQTSINASPAYNQACSNFPNPYSQNYTAHSPQPQHHLYTASRVTTSFDQHPSQYNSNKPFNQYEHDKELKKKKRNKALAIAAGVGGVGLGAYAISRAFTGGDSDNDNEIDF